MDFESVSDKYLQKHRNKWEYRGKVRPDFAIEPLAGQESVWDYPRPPAVVADQRVVQVAAGSRLIAKSQSAVRICETAGPPVFYIPPADIDFSHLVQIEGSSICEWKGIARYWGLSTNRQEIIGWDYPQPFPEFSAIAGYLSFYPGRIQCTVDGERVRSQPGGFYGGWVTDEIVGPFKGEPGTEHW